MIPALALLAGCSGISVNYDYDRGAAFAAMRTYRWFTPADGAAAGAGSTPTNPIRPKAETAANPIMERRVRRIVERELAAKGLRPAGGDADVLVAYYPVFRDRIVQTYTGLGPAWGYGWGWRPWDYGVAGGFVEVQRFREGSIVLELVDPRSRQVVWHAVAEGALTGLRDPQDAEEQVALAVRKMLARFPPPGD
jgi:hypothetical protein